LWAAIRDGWPEAREQRDSVHRIGNVLHKLSTRFHPKAKVALREMMRAESKEVAQEERERFRAQYEATYPQAVETLFKGKEKLLTYLALPAKHWMHIRTGNPIE
jgi:transposase-like protein